MEVLTWIVAHWHNIVIPAVIGLAGWFSARKKNKLDLSSQESDNVSKNLQIFQTMLDDSTARFKEMIALRDEENKLLRQQNTELKVVVSELTDKVDRLTREIRKLERIIKNRADDTGA